ncbi:flagellar filament capping protein FliD [Rhodanobacter sp. Si-c]|uniref:Flagellar hook-associated protein 2 n=1 Tax=Rhodanobacter lycopersici TaxID=3162487 RepID=A0ABV3QHR4_9GAMM
MTSISSVGSTTAAGSYTSGTGASSSTSGSGYSGASGYSSGTSSSSGSYSYSGAGSSAILSSLGVGSGLDVNSIIDALVNAKAAGPRQQISNQTTQLQAQEAGLTALSSALSAMQDALTTLGSITTYRTYTSTLSNTAVGTATTQSSAQPGTYDIVVNSLATAQKRVSGAYASGSAVGAGTLTVAVGGSSMNIDVSSTASINDIASAINGSSSNPGVQATVVNGANGAQLLLTSTQTGVANAFTVTADASSSSGLTSLANTLNTPGSNEAADASLSIDGVAVTSASNTVSSALPGVTLSLAATGSTTLTVAQDPSAVTTAVNNFVTAYNSYASTVSSLNSYDPTSQQAGVLLGDSTLMSVQRQINSILSGGVAGNSIGSLAALGISRNADGTLSVDSNQLNSQLQSNPSAVQGLFASANGYATTLGNALNSFTGSGGIISTRVSSIQSQLTNLSQEQTALTARMTAYATQLRQQYTALDTLMSTLKNTSSSITTSLNAMLNNNSSSN